VTGHRIRPIFVLALVAASLVLVACPKKPKPQEKSLQDKIRPYQMGTQIQLGEYPSSTSHRSTCSFGFYARNDGSVYPQPQGLVTAAHCTNMRLDGFGDLVVESGEPIWQSTPENSSVIARVTYKARRYTWSDTLECSYDIDGRQVDYCLKADAAYADFVNPDDDPDQVVGAVANVPLSTDETLLKPVDTSENGWHEQTGVFQEPVIGQMLFKVGRSTGKTRGTVVEVTRELPVGIESEYVVLLRLYRVVREFGDEAPLVDGGDSGGPAMQVMGSDTENEEGPFTLVGLVSAKLRGSEEVLFVEPVSDIQQELDIIPLPEGVGPAGSGGNL